MTTHLPPLSCEEVFSRLDAYLDRTLAPEEVERVQEHLETCAECASEYRFEESLLAELRAKLERIQAPPDLMARIVASFAGEPPPGDD